MIMIIINAIKMASYQSLANRLTQKTSNLFQPTIQRR